MRVAVSLLPDPTRIGPDVDVAIVIDVLRATSVMATAIAAGAQQIITCRAVEEAWQIAGSFDCRPLLCGERGCRPIEGFDLGNSPAEYTPDRVAGRTLVLTTTNGTAAIAAASAARLVMTASFLNASRTIAAVDPDSDVHLVCAGTNGAITAEDVLLAGWLVEQFQSRGAVELRGDEATIARALWCQEDNVAGRPRSERLVDRLRNTQGGRNLIAVGYEADLGRCAAIDSQPVVVVQAERDPASFRGGEKVEEVPRPAPRS